MSRSRQFEMVVVIDEFYLRKFENSAIEIGKAQKKSIEFNHLN